MSDFFIIVLCCLIGFGAPFIGVVWATKKIINDIKKRGE